MFSLPDTLETLLIEAATRNPALGRWLDASKNHNGVALSIHRALLKLQFPHRSGVVIGEKLVPQHGEIVERFFPGVFGMPIRIKGVVQGRNVKVLEGATNRKSIPADQFYVTGDPLLVVRRMIDTYEKHRNDQKYEQKRQQQVEQSRAFKQTLTLQNRYELPLGSWFRKLSFEEDELIDTPYLIIAHLSDPQNVIVWNAEENEFREDADPNQQVVLDGRISNSDLGQYQLRAWEDQIVANENSNRKDRWLYDSILPEVYDVAKRTHPSAYQALLTRFYALNLKPL